MTLQKVQALRDESGHWYVIPSELREEWTRLNNIMDEDNETASQEAVDKFIETFNQYRTGGDLNNVQLYAEI